ncbi:MAG: hypothetical protein ACTJHT_11060 [Sphingobacterium sp.]
MNKIIAATLLSVLFITQVQGQKKDLNFSQSWGRELSVTNNINQYTGWVDARHYLEKDITNDKIYSVDVKTGERVLYKPAPKSDVVVFVKENDIYQRWNGCYIQRMGILGVL